jgi:hypothetical protein
MVDELGSEVISIALNYKNQSCPYASLIKHYAMKAYGVMDV